MEDEKFDFIKQEALTESLLYGAVKAISDELGAFRCDDDLLEEALVQFISKYENGDFDNDRFNASNECDSRDWDVY